MTSARLTFSPTRAGTNRSTGACGSSGPESSIRKRRSGGSRQGWRCDGPASAVRFVRAALRWLETNAPGPVKIGAQSYLERFYGSFGFAPEGTPYVEDGIPHMHMIRARQD